MKLLHTLPLIFASVITTGCATKAVVEPDSESLSLHNSPLLDYYDFSYSVVDETEAAGRLEIPQKGQILIETAEPISQTVKQDITALLDQYAGAEDSQNRVLVTIRKSDAYFQPPESTWIPFANFLMVMVDDDYTYTMDLEVEFQIEQNGRIQDSFQIAEKIQLQDATGWNNAEVQRSVKRLIGRYREVLSSRVSGFMVAHNSLQRGEQRLAQAHVND